MAKFLAIYELYIGQNFGRLDKAKILLSVFWSYISGKYSLPPIYGQKKFKMEYGKLFSSCSCRQ